MSESTKERHKPRLADVAAAAGVSIATVSRVLDDHPAIGPETKARVLRSVAALGYPLRNNDSPRPRRRLRRAHLPAGGVCVVLPAALPAGSPLANYFELSLIGGIGAAMRDRGMDFTISCEAPYDSATLATFMARRTQRGVIFLGQSQFNDGLNAMAAEGHPFVVWGIETPDQQYCSIGSDNYHGGWCATTHLIRGGRTRIAYFGQVAAITTAQTAFSQQAQRMAGYSAALAEAGLANDLRILRPFGPGRMAGAEAVEALLAQRVEFDGIVAVSDLMAVGAIDALQRHGRRVPEDVAVIGYDDTELASMVRPGLTSVRQDPIVAGDLLVSRLLRLMDGHAARSERLPTEIAIRQSCGS